MFLSSYSTLDVLPSGEAGGTALSLFPMPLPYREASFAAKEEEMPDRNDLPRKQAMNVIVLALNFLAAGRSLQPPVLMGRRLNPRQWRAVRRMELFLEAWLHVSPIGPSEMGRTAGKVESIEDQLLDLTQRAKILSQYKNQYFGSPDLSSQKGDPNVRRGTVVGQLAFDPMTTFKPVDPSRLAFTGVPSFDPRSFLDPVC